MDKAVVACELIDAHQMTQTQIWTLLFLTQWWGSGKDGRWGSEVRQLQWDKAGLQLNYVHTPPDTSVCSRSTATCRQFPLWLSCLLPVSPWEQRAACSASSSPSALFLSLCPRQPFSSFGKITRFSDLETVADLAGCSERQRARLCVSLTHGAKKGRRERQGWKDQSEWAAIIQVKFQVDMIMLKDHSQNRLWMLGKYFLFAHNLFFWANVQSVWFGLSQFPTAWLKLLNNPSFAQATIYRFERFYALIGYVHECCYS